MRLLYLLALLTCTLMMTETAPAQTPPAPTAIPLWPGGTVPGARGTALRDTPTLTPYLPVPSAGGPRAAIVICPGGGYGMLAEHEGRDYALFLSQQGLAAFVLKYRLGSQGYRHPAMLNDAARAIRLVRTRASEWQVDPRRIGIMGSSAGGHLASTALTHFDVGHADAADAVERASSRPDFGVLCYAVISMQPDITHAGSRQNLLGDTPSPELIELLSNEKQVTSETPPCFIWHTFEDDAVKVENALAFASALRKNKVPFDLHVYQKGRHGIGLADLAPFAHPHPWAGDLVFWLRQNNFLTPTVADARPKVVGYVPNWIDLPGFAETIDYGKVTHLNIAFENPTNADGDLSFSKANDVLITKAHAKGVQVLVSIGGGSASGDKKLQARYFDLLTDAKRAAFARKLADYVVLHKLDGLDVDIEGPSINKDYGAFIAELAKVLKPRGKLLTAALSKGYGGSNVPDSVFAHFDFLNIMAYDGAGYWNPDAPGQHSSLDFAKDNVTYWLGRGLPKSKAVLGVPFYGYGFGTAFRKGDYPYSELVASHPGAENVDQIGATIWYNGLPTIKAKSQYVVDQGLAGIMIWSLDYDVKGKSLLTGIHETLHPKPVASTKKP